jgi:D-tyrosyl-tRNA(Tyr) deacylase
VDSAVETVKLRPLEEDGKVESMRAVVQRVSRASVVVAGEIIGEIGQGLMALVGVTHDDNEANAIKLADKLSKLRIFSDINGKMNLSVDDVGGGVLVISQFTLYGDAKKGNRPSFVNAARPEMAEPLIDRVVAELRTGGLYVATGCFGADMNVSLLNEGPVTLILDV